ncbi:MAG TPA: hypothetical protein VGI10_10055 [Polyangiaceae bacterium]
MLCAAWFAWAARRLFLTPWATYVRHTVVKSTVKKDNVPRYVGSKEPTTTTVQVAAYLITVTRVHWYPPYLNFSETWASHDGKTWAREGDGVQASAWQNTRLSNAISIAVLRELETEQLLSKDLDEELKK